MRLNLVPYQAPIPYPDVQNVNPDKQLAAKLMEGYSGGHSELTTILQYAYHSLRCKNKYDEISQTMRGIFYVETLHMEYLGNCINKLGGDVQYVLLVQERTIYWQASLVDYGTSPEKMLLADIEGEKHAADYYIQTAAEVDQPDIKKLLLRLAKDEKLHEQMLSDLYRKFFRRSPSSKE